MIMIERTVHLLPVQIYSNGFCSIISGAKKKNKIALPRPNDTQISHKWRCSPLPSERDGAGKTGPRFHAIIAPLQSTQVAAC